MSRIVSEEELNLIEQVISEHPEGIGISALEKTVSPLLENINRRTLQRRLKLLLRNNRITTEGKSIALVYKTARNAVNTVNPITPDSSLKTDVELYITTSPEGRLIRDFVRQPLMRRKPIGYERSFLQEYMPGVTFYLPDSLRSQLQEMGRTPAPQRPAGTYAREILNRLLIDLSWASSRLEGNTYSRIDTRNLIEFGQAAEGKDIQETQMILNHKAAIEMLIEEADQVGFNHFTILNLHAILSENLMLDEDSSGRLRRRPVEIGASTFLPLAMPQVIEEYFDILLQKASAIPDPFEQAFFMMVQLPYLQPFEDVNKRVSRLAANIPLIQNNLCPLSFVDVPEQAYIDGTLGVYELNQVDLLRDVFVWVYERSCQRYLAITQTVAEPNPLRIRYREILIQTVQSIVRGGQVPSEKLILQLTGGQVLQSDREEFIIIALDTLQRLHEGNIARYRLKLSEFQAWTSVRNSQQASWNS